ncbi:dethiobiotin synthase [Ehrlichia ruminantium]|uniref:dethiobiotin synthase n=1 Tax=Ehrlichia ruminantium TaxID=779 RepID=UPI0015DCBB48|nr:dethiobiotin synthase [Ehrlichia ruminantium]QLK59195.1 dethiobiotin synthase [Ehrlichia ruminantium]
MSAYFITSCGTGIGKTFITTVLCWHLRKNCKTVHAIKPIISGWNDVEIMSNDTSKILCSLDVDCNTHNINKISPWRLSYPHAPNIAARLENIKLDYNEIFTFCYTHVNQDIDYLLIEGVGGVMSPITDQKTCLELIQDLKIKVILVIGSYLGSISHTLTVLKVLGDIDVKIVLSVNNKTDTNINDIVKFIYEYTGKLVYVQQYVKDNANKWESTSDDIVNFIL